MTGSGRSVDVGTHFWRLAVVLGFLVLTIPGSEAVGQGAEAMSLERARDEARRVLQGRSDARFIDADVIEETATALLHIYETIPEVRGITNYGDPSYLVFHPADSVRSRIDTLAFHPDFRGISHSTVESLGIPGVDSLHRELGVDSVTIHSVSGRIFHFEPHFPDVPNVPVLAASYRGLPEVRYAGADLFVGDGHRVQHFRKDERWYFVFARGSGDCPAGCIRRDYHYVVYDPDARDAELVQSRPDGTLPADTVPLWDSPVRYTGLEILSYDDLLARTGATRWWIRRHAVRMVSHLLDLPEDLAQSRRRAPNPEHLRDLQGQVLENRAELLMRIADLVADPDDDVRSWALYILESQTGVHLGDGEEGSRRWREWLRQGADAPD